MDKEKAKSPLGVVSFILGIVSVLSATIYYVTIPCGILSIIFGVKSKRKVGSKLGTTGMILGIVGLSLFVVIYGLFITAVIMNNL